MVVGSPFIRIRQHALENQSTATRTQMRESDSGRSVMKSTSGVTRVGWVWAVGEVYLTVGGEVAWRWYKWDSLENIVELPDSLGATSTGCRGAGGFAGCLGALSLMNRVRHKADRT